MQGQRYRRGVAQQGDSSVSRQIVILVDSKTRLAKDNHLY